MIEMAKQYKANATTFTPIAETSGIIYNAGATDAELVSATNQTNGQGLLLRSGTAQSFNGTILARSKDYDDDAILNVVDFTLGVGGSVSGGGTSTASAAVQTYTAGTSYKANDLVADGTNLYIVASAFTATTVASDVQAGNLVQVNAASGGAKTYATGTAYSANDLIVDGSTLYIAAKAFTASSTSVDTTNGNMTAVTSTSTSASGAKTYTAGDAYAVNDLVVNGTDLYIVQKAFTATTVSADETAGNISLVNGTTVNTTSSTAFMTTAEVDALFA